MRNSSGIWDHVASQAVDAHRKATKLGEPYRLPYHTPAPGLSLLDRAPVKRTEPIPTVPTYAIVLVGSTGAPHASTFGGAPSYSPEGTYQATTRSKASLDRAIVQTRGILQDSRLIARIGTLVATYQVIGGHSQAWACYLRDHDTGTIPRNFRWIASYTVKGS